jgi:phenylacetate-coenzyme A ligase PaaK-like adenylate-forming protein
MTFVAKWRSNRLQASLSAYRQRDAAPNSPSEAVDMQLADLNAAWKQSLARSTWARAIAQAETLPDQFASWAEFDERTPVMDKKRLRQTLAECENSAEKVQWRATGGSTGEPFIFPVWPEEGKISGLDIWLGRSRLGIHPDDPVFLLWGHAHLLGTGVKGAINKIKRGAFDRLLGYTRVSAYALTPADLLAGCNRLLARKPVYVVGYSSALDRFARQNSERAGDIAKLKLKAVIATAEGFQRSDSAEVVSHTFGAPVVMEYGAVETGPLAYQDQDGTYPVFHAHYRLSLRGGEGPAANEILVTSLYPRALPLMRYALGDLAEVAPGDIEQGSLMRLRRVVGRCNDIVTLPNAAAVHSEAFTHCVRDISELDAFQVVIGEGAWPRIRYTASDDLPDNAVSEIRRRLSLIDQGMEGTAFERVDNIALSVAGKHQMIVKS